MIKKLQDRSLLRSTIVRYSSYLALLNMINHKDLCVAQCEKPVEKLYKNNRITSLEVENSKIEFSNFLFLAQQHHEKF